MSRMHEKLRHLPLLIGALALLTLLLLTGCPLFPPVSSDYDQGFQDGFARNDWYWQGYWDSWDNTDGVHVYYQGDQIPAPTSPDYDVGYWDGVWYAYNDGYFVAYDFAFVIGFSEGYDLYYDDHWRAYAASDPGWFDPQDGGFYDGYNDGFLEGSVFGAYDHDKGLSFDWLGALLDYKSGTDVCVQGLCSGEVLLYEWGVNPFTKAVEQTGSVKTLRTLRATPIAHAIPSLRNKSTTLKFTEPELTYRPLTADAREELNVRPSRNLRTGHDVLLTTTWLERIQEYLRAIGQAK